LAKHEAAQHSDKGVVPHGPRKRNGVGRMKDSFSEYQGLKVVLSVVLLVFAITRFYYYEALSTRMDPVFLLLVFSVFLLWMLPWEQLWERLRGFSVGGVEISLQQPDVQAAISNISFDAKRVKISGSSEMVRDRLLRRLKSLEGELQTVRGGRVLWIDDNPHEILGERRLLRALGIDVTPASSSEEAEDILKKDNDFDLIITDVLRFGTSYKFVDKGKGQHEGVNFIVKLRAVAEDKRIRTLPVIFYGAYSWKQLFQHTSPTRELQLEPKISESVPEPEISESAVDLIPMVITVISEERLNPILVSAKKKPTGAR
jgi:CheY-like chemotaxis protein